MVYEHQTYDRFREETSFPLLNKFISHNRESQIIDYPFQTPLKVTQFNSFLHKTTSILMSKKGKRFQNRDVYERINFLTEAAKAAASNPDLINLSQFLGSEADLTTKKSNIRIKPKHVLCKKCHTPLIFDTTTQISVGPQFSEYKCLNCGTKKKVFHSDKIHQRYQHEITHVTLSKPTKT